MPAKKPVKRRARGKAGILTSLLGTWKAELESPMGPLKCTRTFTPILNGKYIQLRAIWKFSNTSYEEHALFGDREGSLSFWSFTSDGKRSEGTIADGTDVHPEAVCFEAHMSAGLARMIYWPDPDGGFHWAVESRTKKGWRRFTEHHYHRVG